MKTLTSSISNAILSEIVMYTEKTVTVAYEKRKTAAGKIEKVPVTKQVRVVSKRVPLLTIHVADTERHDDFLKNSAKDSRIGDPTARCIRDCFPRLHRW